MRFLFEERLFCVEELQLTKTLPHPRGHENQQRNWGALTWLKRFLIFTSFLCRCQAIMFKLFYLCLKSYDQSPASKDGRLGGTGCNIFHSPQLSKLVSLKFYWSRGNSRKRTFSWRKKRGNSHCTWKNIKHFSTSSAARCNSTEVEATKHPCHILD